MKYFGKYQKFYIPSDAEIGQILSADNAVGDIYTLDLQLDEGEYTAWIVNSFGKRIGYFDASFSQQLALLSAEKLVEQAILSYIAVTVKGEERKYWGEMAVICFEPAYSAEFDTFIARLSERIADDVRPQIDFNDAALDKIVESGGNWLPSQNTILPDNDKTKTYIKRRRSMTEKLVNQGRQKNKGCYVLSWAFILLVIIAIVILLKIFLGL